MSWIWRNNHGEALTYKVTGKGVWLCRYCYEKPQKQLFTCPSLPTNVAQRYIAIYSYDLEGNLLRKRKADDDGLTQSDIRNSKLIKR